MNKDAYCLPIWGQAGVQAETIGIQMNALESI